MKNKGFGTILFVDDEEKAVKYFIRLFAGSFDILSATNINDAKEILFENHDKINVIIADQKMSSGTGVQLLNFAKEKYPNIIRILTTAYASIADNIDAINKSHIFSYIKKPWNLDEVRLILNEAISEHQTKMALLSLGTTMAHEIKSPLNIIGLALQEIKDYLNENNAGDLARELTEKVEQMIEISANSIKRARNIINITLDNLKSYQPSPENYHNIWISEVIDTIFNEYAFKDVQEKDRVVIDIKDDFMFRGDETLFMYVMFNLIKNALFYYKEFPELKLTITSEIGRDKNRLVVRDNGPGIPEDKMNSIFSSFITSGKKSGTGLGLSFCKKVMSYFNGDIICGSKLGEWTEFILIFPKISTTERKEDLRILHNIGNKSFALSDKKILMVEDEEVSGSLLKHQLAKLVGRIIWAKDGEDALNKIDQSEVFDIVFMDIEMPKMNGLECAKRIQQIKKYENIPIIAVTGNSDQEGRDKAKTFGIQDLVEKPVSKDAIENMIFKWCG